MKFLFPKIRIQKFGLAAYALACCLALPGVLAPSLAAAPVKIMAFGDSLVHGYGLPNGESFPSQLAARLAAQDPAVSVVNAGNSGDTTAAGLARLDWALAEEPDAVIVVFGGNDGLRGLEPSETYANLSAMLDALEARGLPVLLAGMLAPRNLGAAYTQEFDAVFQRLAAEHAVIFYPFFLEGVAAEPALNQVDGIHPNGAGVAAIVERMLPSVERLIRQARGG